MAGGTRHTSLVAWQRADDLFVRLHRLASTALPVDERFELASQLRRAALSVPTNIVEGIARSHRRETLHFLQIAWGSLQEVGYFIHVAQRLGYITGETAEELTTEVRRTAAPLSGLLASYKDRPLPGPREQ